MQSPEKCLKSPNDGHLEKTNWYHYKRTYYEHIKNNNVR